MGKDHVFVKPMQRAALARATGCNLESQTCAEVEGIASAHLKDVQDKITDLQRIAKALSDTVAQCSGTDVPECPVLNALLG